MKCLFAAIAATLMAFACMSGVADASVVIAGTRVIFPAAGGEITVRLNNNGEQPALVEAWLDDGDATSTPDSAHVPFVITPPLFRMNPGKGQSLRIVYTGEKMPSDRESLFWLNVLEIPPKPADASGEAQNTLQFAVRSRLKFFYRPAALTSDALKAAQQITWTAVAQGAGYALVAHNPTPYYVTFSKLSVSSGNMAYTSDPGMVAPMSTLSLLIKDLNRAPALNTVVDYTAINDFGTAVSYQGKIAQ